jgi:hypothetical protein
MNVKLAVLCSRLWGVGFAGMWVARGVFDRGPGEIAFDLSTWACAVGGLTYVLLALMYLSDHGQDRVSA